MNPSKPSEWIKLKADQNYAARVPEQDRESGFISAINRNITKTDSIIFFLDLLHSQGKIEMPDLPSNPET